MFPSQVTLPIQLASNIWLPALIRSGQLKITNVISLLLPAVVRDVLCILIIWLRADASYGLTDSMGGMHGDAQFAGSSSVPAHVEMMGLSWVWVITQWLVQPLLARLQWYESIK